MPIDFAVPRRYAVRKLCRRHRMTATRTETDSFGPLEVPANKYWGAQTQRSIINFPIGWERQPVPIIRALGVIKKACAEVNMAQGDMAPELGKPSPPPHRR
jgi:fumarate hydratase class II